MPPLDDRLRQIGRGPSGPRIGAFFDYDGTLISGFSALAFYTHRLRRLDIGPRELGRTLVAIARGVESDEDFEAFLELSLEPWAGRPAQDLEELAEQLFKHDIASRLHHEVWRLVQAHRRKGHTIALATSATRFQVEPMARAIEADAVLCTPIEERDGIVSGRVDGATLWGTAKAAAVRTLARERGIELERSYGYSNGDEDIPFLEAVGRPCAVQPEGGLAKLAAGRGWPVIRCTSRGGPAPRPVDVARTAGFYGGMAAAVGAGLGAGLLNRSRRTFIEITGGLGADLGLALAGVDVRIVRGREHLWSARPCVFVFNHQSKLDPILMMKLLREDFTGVAKKEAANVPGFGQLFRAAGVAFVDRGNTRQARAVLEPAVAKVRDEGLSLVIAPEGTRSSTPRLGPFKKGAFHIAMQAGVPMVPIVIRNAGEIMWRGAQTISAGTVEVAVLEPVDTSGWRAERIADHVSEVRGMFLQTLAEWPGPASFSAGAAASNGRGSRSAEGGASAPASRKTGGGARAKHGASAPASKGAGRGGRARAGKG